MKNETTRTKTLSGFSSRAIALVLCFVMLLTAIGSGSVLSAIAADFEGNGAAVLVDAAKAGASVDVAAADEEASDKAVDDDNSEPNYEVVPEDDVDDVLKLNKKADADIADTGWDGNAYIKGEFNGWGEGNSGSISDNKATISCYFDSTGSQPFKVVANGQWFGNGETLSNSTNSETNLAKGNGDNASIDIDVAGRWTFFLSFSDNAVTVKVQSKPSSSSGNTDKMYIFGNFNGHEKWGTDGTSTGRTDYEMTYMGSNGTHKYYTYILSAGSNTTHYFKFYNKVGNTDYFWGAKDKDNDIEVTTNREDPTKGWRSDTNKAYKVTNPSVKKTVWVYVDSANDDISVWVTPETAVYLTGYVNGSDTDGTTYPFTSSTGNNWTYTLTSTAATQYVTIWDNNSSAYHPATHGAGNGVAADPTKTDKSPKKDNKWLVTGAQGKNITFTWNALTNVLSWTIGGNSVTVYAKDGAAPIDWDKRSSSSKEYPGATGMSGLDYGNPSSKHYNYNFAAIARTKMYNSGGGAITGITETNCDINDSTNDYSGSSWFQTASLEAGTKIKITTTISDSLSNGTTTVSDLRSKYYVKGWCINGVTYKCGDNVKGVNSGTGDGSSGAYTMYYTIPATAASNTKFEITPIYYFANNTNSITFYLEGYDKPLQDDGWGNTPYCYPFYGNLSGYQNSFGVYPGQPMVYVDGKYSMAVPITSNAIFDSAKNGTIIKGVTVNNGYADHVHRNLIYNWDTKSGDEGNDETHRQTYDFDDFYKIYNEKRDSNGNKPNAIILRIKRDTTRYNRDIYGDAYNTGTNGYSSYINWGFGKNDPYTSLYGSDSTSTSQYVKDIAKSGNGWELLTDRYGRPVDLFGNVISTTYSASAETAKPAIRVVSTGYNENMAGDYATGWLIYTPDSASGYDTAITNADGTSAGYIGANYTLQTANGGTATRKAVPPSVFLLNSSSSFSTTTYPNVTNRSFDGVTYSDTINNYKNLYNTLNTSGTAGTNAKGRYVYITYESDQQRKGKTNSSSDTNAYGAKRLDARWYYTYATDMVNADIKIQYYDGTTYVDEAKYTTGYNSKTNQGSYTGCKAYFTNTAFDGNMSSGDVLINSGDFEFKAVSASGWVFDSWQIEYDGGVYTELSDQASASTPMSSKDTLVARFKPLTDGYLNLSHHLSSDSTGAGTTEIQVKVYATNAKTNLLYDSGKTTEDVTLDTNYVSNAVKNNYIEVTLTTTKSGDDVFNKIDAPATADINTDDEKKTFFGDATSTTTNPYTFGFTVDELWNDAGTAQTYKSLPYTSKITKTDHYYKITYMYPKRGSANSATDGQLTTYGTFTAKEYESYVTISGSTRTVADAFIISKAPYESNFLKDLTLNVSSATQRYNTSDYTHTITATFSQQDDLATYAIFDLPYEYYAPDDDIPGGSKIYTAKVTNEKVVENHDTLPVEIDTTYNNYFTNGANNPAVVTKVTDVTDVNHAGNDFITAPEEIWDGSTRKFFKYWEVRNIADNQLLLQIRYPDFNYRSCGNYHIEPIYSENESDSWKVNYTKGGISTSILYLDSTRNQWNSSDSTNTTSSAIAADLIYNDFLLSFYYNGQEIKNNASIEDCGMIIELVPTTKGGSTYALGDASTPGTSGYKTTYAASIPDNDTLVGIANGTVSGKYIRINTDSSGNSFKSQVNDKNRYEFSYSFYSQYGQANATGGNSDGYAFKTDSAVDNYVYRAYTYIKDSNDNVTISEPAYFSMKYTASR